MRLGRIKFGRSILSSVAIVALAIGIIWSQRRPIAASAIDRALAARGILASYEIREIGFRTQRIEKLRLGDPASPDLTADWAEVSLIPSWGGVTVTAINASGVRLRGRVVQGRVSWGAVDRLLPASAGKPLTLPHIDVRLADTQVSLATDAGVFKSDIAGSGRLSDGFKGRVRTTASIAGRAGCSLAEPIAETQVTVRRRRPVLVGELRAAPSTCGTLTASNPTIRFDVTLNEAFDNWQGTANVAAGNLAQGAAQITQARSRIVFWGTAKETRGSFKAASPESRYAGTRILGLSTEGRFSAGRAITADGTIKFGRVIADPAHLVSVRRAIAGAVGTPVGPIAESLSKAIGRAGKDTAAETRFAYDGTTTSLSDLRVASRSGAVFTLRNGTIVVGAQGLSANAEVKLSGGGFPSIAGHFTRTAEGTTRGLFAINPYRVGNAQLSLAPVRFAARADGTLRAETMATLDGPLGGGRAEGLVVPVVVQRASSGDIVFAPGCTLVSYRRVALAGTTLAPGSITLCPTRGGALARRTNRGIFGGARTGPLRLTGQVGDQPLALSASIASFDLGGPVSLSGFSALMGSANRRTQLRIARLNGVTRTNGLAGRYSGLSGNIARVPFLANDGQGTWTFAHGVLNVGGKMMLADQADKPRFNAVSAEDIKFRLASGKVDVTASVHEPVSTRALTTIAVAHDLSRVAGEARFLVNGLNFSKSLQPEAVTPLTLGVVADVYGQIDGEGVVRWNGDKVTSSGTFRTDALDLAAAFGPVSGISGEIVFDDLLSLSTRAGQQVKLATVNPGVEVKDGVISFRLLPKQIVEIERGHWPFAGGELVLEPASLDFGRPAARNLSFRVIGLDAAKFIEQLKLENIAATGTFDGTLPIVFDASGGRIVGGTIVARAGGGMLAYVGDVSNAQTNTLAKLAFDALKSVRYSNLAIDLDGSLDGEIISLVRFDGVNQSPVTPSGLAKSFTNLPFRFNIRVRAPFRGLVNTARSFQDPGLLLNQTVQPVAIDKRQ